MSSPPAHPDPSDQHLCLDFRSDTRTRPDAAMRAAMAAAEVGDDAYGDDPTVRALEEEGARLTGKQAALFLPSSTMANLVAVLAAAPAAPAAPAASSERGAHTRLVTGEDTHIARFESAAMRRFGGVRLVGVAQHDDGSPEPVAFARALDDGRGQPLIVSLENTCMLQTGNALDASTTWSLASLAREYGAHVHLDGARLANAAVARQVPVRTLAAAADSVTFCLAKGLGAPVGSLLCGGAAFVDRSRELRLQLGGTMHQAGVAAAAALVALRRLPRLADDHALAAALAAGLASVRGADVAVPPRRTNIVTVRLAGLDAAELQRRLAARGVRVLPLDHGRVRFVVHREHVAAAVPDVVRALAGARAVSASVVQPASSSR
ncbi:L-threonine aldolase [Streptomyces sp. SLBN-118]|uniref:GntG family PLP-dependent aldolase n=1 Tax=Streptomyces sp. SLBN-118 TaxID=2768454 RepID=UPI00114E07C2|nr:GntG family PLP-dependent aldolase [Streptomyces sp. SLBN-118]TQK50339.1 L-threonine aldolase [Streptomyces sp. SLBN-118]